MRIAIMQPGYIPWLGFFELVYNSDVFVILDDVQYTKKDWRSRNRIRTKTGWMWLSVPVLTKGKRNQLIMEARINNDIAWGQKHLGSLKINYCRAKYYSDYINFFEQLYEKKWNLLIDLDMEIISFMTEKLGITTPVIKSSSLGVSADSGNTHILEICKILNADELYDSQGAASFIDLKLFNDAGVKVIFQNYNHPLYIEAYKPFIPYMSAIDLLFNHGPDSLSVIMNKRIGEDESLQQNF